MSISLPPPPLSVEAVAKRYGCSARHIRAMVSTGELPCLRLGKLLRFPLDAIIAFEASAGPKPAPAAIERSSKAIKPANPQVMAPEAIDSEKASRDAAIRFARARAAGRRAAARSE